MCIIASVLVISYFRPWNKFRTVTYNKQTNELLKRELNIMLSAMPWIKLYRSEKRIMMQRHNLRQKGQERNEASDG